jgi:integrase
MGKKKATRRGHGEGSIYRRASDGRWVGTIDLGWETGKRQRKTVYGRTQAEVIEKLDRLKTERREGRLPAAGQQPTVEQYLREWVGEHLPGTVADTTLESYRYIVEQHVIPVIGRKRLDRLEARDVQRLLNTKRDEGLSPKTCRYIHSIVRRALGVAERWGLVGRNVARLVETPRVPTPEPKAFTRDEVRRIMISAEAERLGPLIFLALMTGLRLGELLGLRWDDIDLAEGMLRVQRTRRRTGTVAEPKTAAGRRTVTLPPTAVDLLREHRDQQGRERRAAAAWEDAATVFVTSEGRPLGHRFVQRIWYRVLKRAKVESRGFHHLRMRGSRGAATGCHAGSSPSSDGSRFRPLPSVLTTWIPAVRPV